jgi:hypothetical protein
MDNPEVGTPPAIPDRACVADAQLRMTSSTSRSSHAEIHLDFSRFPYALRPLQ